jgi:hypothetical protein
MCNDGVGSAAHFSHEGIVMSVLRLGSGPDSRSPGRGSWAWIPAACASPATCGGSWSRSPAPMALVYSVGTAAAAGGGVRATDAKQALFRCVSFVILAHLHVMSPLICQRGSAMLVWYLPASRSHSSFLLASSCDPLCWSPGRRFSGRWAVRGRLPRRHWCSGGAVHGQRCRAVRVGP